LGHVRLSNGRRLIVTAWNSQSLREGLGLPALSHSSNMGT
jgi:hypothetical protein